MAIVVSIKDEGGRSGSARPATAATKSPPSSSKRARRSRDPLSPRPILDRRLLLKYIDAQAAATTDDNDDHRDRGSVSLTARQVDVFYQQLHRADYPPLPTLARSLLRQEGCRKRRNDNNTGSNGTAGDGNNGKVVNDDEGWSGGGDVVEIKTELPQLPRNFLLFLLNECDTDDNSQFVTLTSVVQCARTSSDGCTTKLAICLQDGHVVETVVMRHDDSRVTVCVSSQVGCAMGCTFCATGTMGIWGNLTAGEILEQLVHAQRVLDADDPSGVESSTVEGKNKLGRIRNVVFMGMGEPLNNYRNVVEACRALINKRTWNLAHRHVTVSTVGVVNRMRDLTRDMPEVSLALSLHAPNQEMRSAIVPTARHYPIEELIDALDDHMMTKNGGDRGREKGRRGDGDGKNKKQKKKKAKKKGKEGDELVSDVDLVGPRAAAGDAAMTCTDAGGNDANATTDDDDVARRKSAGKKKKAMIEYVMLEGDTSTIECAHQLGRLCENRYVVVNLIPYNKTNVKDELSCPSEERIAEFQRIVSSYGCYCFVRRTMGSDIAGACGQLVVEDGDGTGTDRDDMVAAAGDVDIEDGPFGRQGGEEAGRTRTRTTTGDGRQRGRVVSFPSDRRGSKTTTTTTTAASSPPAEGRDRSRVGDEDPPSTAADGGVARRCDDAVGWDGDFARWVRPLAAATAMSASCFVVSTAIFLARRKKR